MLQPLCAFLASDETLAPVCVSTCAVPAALTEQEWAALKELPSWHVAWPRTWLVPPLRLLQPRELRWAWAWAWVGQPQEPGPELCLKTQLLVQPSREQVLAVQRLRESGREAPVATDRSAPPMTMGWRVQTWTVQEGSV